VASILHSLPPVRLLRNSLFAETLRRLAAAGAAALVLALTIFAASPDAHDSLHESGLHDHDSGCAIELFAGGVSPSLDFPAVQPPFAATGSVTPPTAAEVYLVTPRYLRQPERGPPSLG
jgi:hypothetical protein